MEQQSHVIIISILQSQKNQTFLREPRSPSILFLLVLFGCEDLFLALQEVQGITVFQIYSLYNT
jgi:hypothetical protein